MRSVKIIQKVVLVCCLSAFSPTFGQAQSSTVMINGPLTIHGPIGLTEFSRGVYSGPNAAIVVNGPWDFASRDIFFHGDAQVSGTDTLSLNNPQNYLIGGVPPSWFGQQIDGGAVPLNLHVKVNNPAKLSLTSLNLPAGLVAWAGTATPQSDDLVIGKNLIYGIDKGHILLNGEDLVFDSFATQERYNEQRYAITNGNGHVVHRYLGSTPKVFPIGRAEGDYTPAVLAKVSGSPANYWVQVKNYSESQSVEQNPTAGIDRSWHIYTDGTTAANETRIELQHNNSSNGGLFNISNGFVTRQNNSNDVSWTQGPPSDPGGNPAYLGPGNISGSEIHSRMLPVPNSGAVDSSWFSKNAQHLNPFREVNQAPIAINNFSVTLEGTPVQGNVVLNDFDPDGDQISAETQPIKGPGNGTISISTNGEFTYMPTPGFVGTDSVEISICDNGIPLACDTGLLVIEVKANNPIINAVNDLPVANDESWISLKDSTVTGNILVNDFDPDGDSIFVQVTPVSGPNTGTLSLNTNGNFVYIPPAGYIGNVSFCYQVCDTATPVNGCNTACTSIEIIEDANGTNNNPPSAGEDAFGIHEGETVSGNVLDNDIDPNGDQLSVGVTPVIAPANGTLVLHPNGNFNYTPNPGFTGTEVFRYSVCDNGSPSLCDTASVSITVFSGPIQVGVNVILSGPFNAVTGLMGDHLRQRNLLPIADPYGLGVTASCNPNQQAEIIDWIHIQLRDKADSTVIVAETAALLKANGSIQNPQDCSDSQVLFQLPGDRYFIVVKHRNHLGIMSQTPVDLNGYVQTFDFTDASAANGLNTYGDHAQATLGGKQALWPGDVNQDGMVLNNSSNSDVNAIANRVISDPGNTGFFTSGPLNTYLNAIDVYDLHDVNMDGQVLDNAIPSDSHRVRNVVLRHPNNTGFFSSGPLNTYIITEQLP